MRCDDFRAAFLAGELEADHFAHLDTCPRCRSDQAGLASMTDALGDPALWAEPSPGLGAGVMAQIAADQPPARPDPGRRRVWPAWAVGVISAAVVASVLVVNLRGGGPDWEVAIAGAGPAAGLEGTVQGWNEPAGTRVAFDVGGLQPAPDGHVYEAWFSRGRVHISAGTFTSLDEAELFVGIARRDYPRVWVTLEPIDEDPAPSDVVVLDTRPQEG